VILDCKLDGGKTLPFSPRWDRQGSTGIPAQSISAMDPDTRVGLNSIREKNMYLAIACIHSTHS
jgi:hypothetical protein